MRIHFHPTLPARTPAVYRIGIGAEPKGAMLPEVREVVADTIRNAEDAGYVRRAISLGDDAACDGDVPVGAVLVLGERVFYARNEKERRPDPTGHAEVLAIRSAAATLGTWRLTGATLYVTKEPCAMCAGAIVAARIQRVVFGCRDPKSGAAGSVLDVFASSGANHHVAVVAGVLADETAAQLRAFFATRRGRGVTAAAE